MPLKKIKKWWETSEGHRFAGEVLQLRVKREIMKFIGTGIKTKTEIERTFGLSEKVAGLHISLLEKAEMIEMVDEGYRSTLIGTAYLKNFEDFSPGIQQGGSR
ncbi:MAG: helix-turn-helix domain-containing protein [Methanotrichaceae archaeon]|nr:helix-turn-helix domain-containing protein [Methanotrichaceae archaeon]